MTIDNIKTLRRILVAGVREGRFVAYDVGDGIRFVSNIHVTVPIARAAIPADELLALLESEQEPENVS